MKAMGLEVRVREGMGKENRGGDEKVHVAGQKTTENANLTKV